MAYPGSKEETSASALHDIVHAKAKWLPTDHAVRLGTENHISKLIQEIKGILVNWLRPILQESCNQHGAYSDLGIKVEIFGGFLLGVATEDSDVDVLCILPGIIQRCDIFSKLPRFLVEQADFKQIRVVSGARVPLIECHTNDVKIDLLFCIICDCTTVPNDLDLLDENCIGLMDATSIFSVNGYRETMAVLQIVPDQEIFQLALKAVKLWAKCQHIHHSSLGFLGGFAWAILVAYICLHHQNSSVDEIFHKFFVTFSNWEMRKAVHITPLQEEDVLNLEPWNPVKRHGDSLHEWPIITPVYPAHNAAFTVFPYTFSIMKSLLAKAASVTEKVLDHTMTWDNLFKPHINFFSHYKHFLIIHAWSTSSKKAFDWFGLLESQIRLLFLGLSRSDGIKLIHPYTEKLSPLKPRFGNEICWTAGLKVDKSHGNLNIAQEVQDFKTKVFSLARERDIYEEGMMVEVKYIKRGLLMELFPAESVKITI